MEHRQRALLSGANEAKRRRYKVMSRPRTPAGLQSKQQGAPVAAPLLCAPERAAPRAGAGTAEAAARTWRVSAGRRAPRDYRSTKRSSGPGSAVSFHARGRGERTGRARPPAADSGPAPPHLTPAPPRPPAHVTVCFRRPAGSVLARAANGSPAAPLTSSAAANPRRAAGSARGPGARSAGGRPGAPARPPPPPPPHPGPPPSHPAPLTGRRPTAGGHPPGRGEDGGDDLLGEQGDVPLHLQQVEHQGQHDPHREQHQASLHQVVVPAAGGAAASAAPPRPGAPRPASGRGVWVRAAAGRQRRGAEHVPHFGRQPSGPGSREAPVPGALSTGTAPAVVVQPGHRSPGAGRRSCRGEGAGPRQVHGRRVGTLPPPPSAHLAGARTGEGGGQVSGAAAPLCAEAGHAPLLPARPVRKFPGPRPRAAPSSRGRRTEGGH